LRSVVDDIRSLGAELVVVGNGRPEQAAAFKNDQNISFPLFVDPAMTAYRAAGLKRGIMDAINLRTAKHALRAIRKGFRQTNVQGDPWQLGGSFVIDPKGNVLFAHTSREAGDHPDPQDILSALRRIKAERIS
jgi:peroxiredoxin